MRSLICLIDCVYYFRFIYVDIMLHLVLCTHIGLMCCFCASLYLSQFCTIAARTKRRLSCRKDSSPFFSLRAIENIMRCFLNHLDSPFSSLFFLPSAVVIPSQENLTGRRRYRYRAGIRYQAKALCRWGDEKRRRGEDGLAKEGAPGMTWKVLEERGSSIGSNDR